jgi:hypothetical protein
MTIYTGYVYLWFDTKSKFYYLGGHQGLVEDAYVCSNNMMLRAYRKRPDTFKFRVLEYVDGGLDDLRNAEQRWLSMIKDTELYWTPNIQNKTVRYYNQKKLSRGGSCKGHPKNRTKPAWNKGYSKVEVELRKNGLLSFIPLDRPITKKKRNNITKRVRNLKKVKLLLTKQCSACSAEFNTYKEKQKTCSKACSGKIAWIRGTAVPGFKKSGAAWNKGLPNPNSAVNGRKGREKQSQTVTGRKLMSRKDGTKYWVYPDK